MPLQNGGFKNHHKLSNVVTISTAASSPSAHTEALFYCISEGFMRMVTADLLSFNAAATVTEAEMQLLVLRKRAKEG